MSGVTFGRGRMVKAYGFYGRGLQLRCFPSLCPASATASEVDMGDWVVVLGP
jgi:hypothetical protein